MGAVVCPCDENIGFVRGNNLGLQHATGRHIMLLNPDTEVFADSLCRAWLKCLNLMTELVW